MKALAVPALTSEELYELCLRGDEEAWRQAYGFVLRVCRWAKWRLRDSPEEMAQAIVTHLLEIDLESVHDPAAFHAFLKRVSINMIIDNLRAPRLPVQSLDQPISDGHGDEMQPEYPDPDCSTERQVISREIMDIIDQSLDRLPGYCRRVLTLYFEMKLGAIEDYHELSEKLGSPVGTISAQVRRCLGGLTRMRPIRELIEER